MQETNYNNINALLNLEIVSEDYNIFLILQLDGANITIMTIDKYLKFVQ